MPARTSLVTSTGDGRPEPDVERRSDAHLAALIDQTIAGIAETDLTGRFLLVNDRYCEITGYPRDELCSGLRMQDITHPDDLAGNLERFERLTADGTPFVIEKRYIRKDGSLAWVHNSVSAVRDEAGRVASTLAVVVDITERQRAEAERQANEARLRVLADATASAIWTAAPTGEVRGEAAGRWASLTDLSPETLAIEWLAAVHADDRAPGDARWWAGIAAGQSFEFEQRVRQSDGTFRHFIVRAVPLRDEDGRIEEWVGADIDITERRQAEAELRERDELLRLTLQAARAGAWAVDLATDQDEWSPEVLPLLGRQPGEVEPAFEHLLAIIHPDDREWLRDKANADIAAGREGQSEFRVIWPDGSVHWILARGRTIIDAAGAPRRVGLFLDITERKQAEISLLENEERLRLGIDVAGFALLEIDYETGVIHLSAEATRLYGLGEDAVTVPREQVHATFHPDERDELLRRIALAPDPDPESPYTTEYRVIRPSGEVRWLSVRKQVIFERESRHLQPRRAVLAALDITERKQAEADRQALLDALAHDLRNPLTALRMQAQLLLRQFDRGREPEREALAERVAGFLELALRMTGLIDDLEQHAHLTTGGLHPDRQPTDLVALVRDGVGEAQQSGGLHPIRIETDEAELVGLWDPLHLQRVLDNLLGNAMKYSPPGSDVWVRLSRDGRHAVLEVRDQGIGIPASDLPHVFVFRHRGGNVGSATGSGVGLAGVKQIVERHGGTVAVESEEGQGSIFTVRLPLLVSGR
jgi:PAS domain S-box-containing protein